MLVNGMLSAARVKWADFGRLTPDLKHCSYGLPIVVASSPVLVPFRATLAQGRGHRECEVTDPLYREESASISCSPDL